MNCDLIWQAEKEKVMKCFEIENLIDLLLDGEAGELQKQELKAHLAVCESCQAKFQLRQQTKNLLKTQPEILPSAAFDRQMLRAFENDFKLTKKKEDNWLMTIFAIPKPIMIGAFAAFIFGLGIMFFLGRLSVSSPPQSNSLAVEKTPQQDEFMTKPTPEIKEVTVTKTEEKIVTKYIKIPVIKEKVVTKNVYLNQPLKTPMKEEKEIMAESDKQKEQKEIVKQFNLKDLQPVANVTYKIIRKVENNER